MTTYIVSEKFRLWLAVSLTCTNWFWQFYWESK